MPGTAQPQVTASTSARPQPVADGGAPRLRRRGRRRGPRQVFAAYVMLLPFLLLLLVAGVLPAGYALLTAFRDSAGGFAGLGNFATIVTDFRFTAAFRHVIFTMAVFLPAIVIFAVGLALLCQASGERLSKFMRFAFYIPGALAGMANFMLWLYILDPTVSPVRGLWQALHLGTLAEVAAPGHLPPILTAMMLFQAMGSWLLIIYGGLNGVPAEVLEAARIDGASAWGRAIHIQIPLIRPWIGYLALMNVAYVFQLFLEPALLARATNGTISPDWSPNQLSYTYAFTVLNQHAAAAMSVILLAITMAIGLVIVTRTNLFGDDA
ncbi:MAG: carbohydrate ABC transporter permease [Nostocoides sp.]